jgi:hypothetical protein
MDVSSPPNRWSYLLMASIGGVAGGFAGAQLGEALSYAIAALADRDIAEIKGTFIWGTIFGLLTGIAGGVWFGLVLIRATPWARRSAMIATSTLLTLGAIAMIAAYEWPKTSGHPVVEYELRFPASAGIPGHSEVDLTVWSEKNGHGAYIKRIEQAGGRATVVGSFAIDKAGSEKTMSLGLRRAGENYWTIPVAPNAPLDKAFGPWQRIEFIPTPRENVAPLPSGDYEVRYRVRRYM